MKRAIIAILLLSVLAVSAAAWAQTPQNPDRWMKELFAEKPAAKDQPLTRFIFPGTHDSGTFRLNDNLACSGCAGTSSYLEAEQNCLDNLSDHGFGSLCSIFTGGIATYGKPWAEAQHRSIGGQLAAGVRVFDLRFFRATGEDAARTVGTLEPLEEGKFYIHHTFAGPELTGILSDIRSFLDNPEHDEEVIMLRFLQMREGSGAMSQAGLEEFFRQVRGRLGSDMAPKQDDACEADPDCAATARFGHSTTIGEMLDQPGGNQVIAFCDCLGTGATDLNGDNDYDDPGEAGFDGSDIWDADELASEGIYSLNDDVLGLSDSGYPTPDDNETDYVTDSTTDPETTAKGRYPWINDNQVLGLMQTISRARDSEDQSNMFMMGLNAGLDNGGMSLIRSIACQVDVLNVSGICGAVADHPVDPRVAIYWDEFLDLKEMADYLNPRAVAALVDLRRDRVNIVNVDHYTPDITQEIYKLNRGATRVRTLIDQVAALTPGIDTTTEPDFYLDLRYDRELAPSAWRRRVQRNLYVDFEDRPVAGGWRGVKAYPNDWSSATVSFRIWDADDGHCTAPSAINCDDPIHIAPVGAIIPDPPDPGLEKQTVFSLSNCFYSGICSDVSTQRSTQGNFDHPSPFVTDDNARVLYRHDVCVWSWLKGDVPHSFALCDTLIPSVSITDVKRKEGASGTTNFDFVVTLSGPSATQLSVDYFMIVDISVIGDIVINPGGTLVFDAGETRKIVTVQVKGDTIREADETFTVNLTPTTNAYVIVDGQAVGTILNDDSPASVSSPTDQSGDEGSAITFDLGTLIDARSTAGGPYDVLVDWGDGLGPDNFGITTPGPLSAGYTYKDNGNYAVTVSITDGDGLTLSPAAFQAIIANVDPTATLSDDGPINEGGSATVTVVASDVSTTDENQGIRYAFSCTDGSLDTAIYASSSTSASKSCNFDDEATNTVRVRVIDKDGGYNEYTTSVTVNGIKPTATLTNNGPIDEGNSVTLTMSNPNDPSAADIAAGFRYAFSCTNGSLAAATYAGSSANASTSCPFPIDGTYTVRARIIDKDGEFNEYTNQVIVRDVAPTLTAAANQTGNEGAAVSFNLGSLSDPGPDGPWTVAVNWGDGANESISLTTPGAMTQSHAYADNGSYTVTVSATDNGGNVSNTVSFTATIANVNPTATPANNGPIVEGGSATISFGGASDPSGVDTTAGFRYAFSCSNGSLAGATYANSGAGASTTCSYPDNGTMTVRGKIIDKDGGSTEYTTTVVVNNLPPTVSIDVVTQNVQYSDDICHVTITATDTPSDMLTAVTSALPGNLTRTDNGCTIAGGLRSCSWTLSGTTDQPMGSYPISIVVSDEDGGSGTVSTDVIVEPEAATIWFDEGNQVAVQVDAPGGDSPAFAFTAYVKEREAQPACNGSSAYPGNLASAQVELILAPVGPGSPYTVACSPVGVTGTEYNQVLDVSCAVDDVAVNTYHVQASVVGDYYAGGPAEDAMIVFDPSLGFTTGGGWFYWPGTTDKTNFGYTMKYKKSGKGIQGNLLLIRHLPDGSIYRVKSNALYGLSIGEDANVPMGWATFSGKCTYLEPGWAEPIGNQEFLVYVEDHDEPGTGNDRFWIEVLDQPLSLVSPAAQNTVTIDGGNIVAPHGSN
jgi:hypothetical protein